MEKRINSPTLAEILKNARERGETLKQQQSAQPAAKPNPKLAEMIEKARERAAQMQSAKPAMPAQPAAKPNPYANNLNDLLSGNANGIVVKSSTPGSEKHFSITVDDNGTISAKEM